MNSFSKKSCFIGCLLLIGWGVTAGSPVVFTTDSQRILEPGIAVLAVDEGLDAMALPAACTPVQGIARANPDSNELALRNESMNWNAIHRSELMESASAAPSGSAAAAGVVVIVTALEAAWGLRQRVRKPRNDFRAGSRLQTF